MFIKRQSEMTRLPVLEKCLIVNNVQSNDTFICQRSNLPNVLTANNKIKSGNKRTYLGKFLEQK